MIESFVDLTYRGLSLGRRVKLTQVRPTTGYLEMPAPMPVGTTIVIATDEGVSFDAIVTSIHEQVGGSDTAPGMLVTPALGDDARESWWRARVGPSSATPPPTPERAKQVTVRPRSHTVPAPPPAGAVSDAADWQSDPRGRAVVVGAPDPEPAGGKTTVMTVDQDLIAQLTAGEDRTDKTPVLRTTGQHAIVDDGQRTTIMDAVDPAALGLDVTASGSFPAATDEDQDPGSTDVGTGVVADDKKPSGSGGNKKRKKRNR